MPGALAVSKCAPQVVSEMQGQTAERSMMTMTQGDRLCIRVWLGSVSSEAPILHTERPSGKGSEGYSVVGFQVQTQQLGKMQSEASTDSWAKSGS